jgi:tetratricopeptide (TPR) repeat protein
LATLNHDEIYPAPVVDNIVPLTVERIRAHLQNEPHDFAANFTLANLLLQQGEFLEAKNIYNELLAREPNNNELSCNYAISLKLLGELDSSIHELKKVTLKSPDMIRAMLQLGLVHQELNSLKQAATAFTNVVKLCPDHIRANLELGLISLKKGNRQNAYKHFQAVIQADSTNNQAHCNLGFLLLEDSLPLFTEGDKLDAFQSWSTIYKLHEETFSQHAPTVALLADLVKTFNDDKEVDKLLEEPGFPNEKQLNKKPDYYKLFSHFFFSLGLMPEVYEEKTELRGRLQTWTDAANEAAAYPYAKFRAGVILCYLGELEKAFAELTACRDGLPSKKQETLKLQQSISFVQKLRRLTRDDTLPGQEVTQGDWEYHGFTDPFQRRAWQQAGLPPEIAALWKAKAISPDRAKHWVHNGITLDEASRWTLEGIESVQEAILWRNAGLKPEEAKPWMVHLPNDQQTALQCVSVGFTDAKEAAEWLRVFMFPSEAIRWKEVDFTPAESLLWKEDGFSDPHQAKQEATKRQKLKEEEV